jgi:cysteine-rich repeat protein
MDALDRDRFAAGILALALAAPAAAQVFDVPDFQAGSPTFASSLQEVDVAPHPDGGFAVVWGEFGSTLGAGNRIVTHRFLRSGLPASPPVRIDTSGYGLYPNIVADKAGGFVGAWMWSKEGTARALYARRLSGAGVGVSSETRVDTPSTGPMIAGSVACRDSGCVYFWKQNGLWVRAYDRFGSPLTSAVAVGSNTPAFEADIDTFADGRFVVVWTNRWLDDRSWARLYHADLTPVGPAFALDTHGLVDEVATGAGDEFAVVGHAHFDEATGGEAGPRGETWMRRFRGDGTPIGDRVVVRTVPASVVTMADAAYDSRGNLFVVWREYDMDSTVMARARARAYSASGDPLGPDFEVTAAPAAEIQTVALADDCFANAWYFRGKVHANVVCLCGGEACGDGVVDGTCEACDDGNRADGDGCDSNCTISGCGNGRVGPGEACDDGNHVDGDGCDSNCTVTACGNGLRTGAEQCDDGNLISDDGCDANCRPSGCGNGLVGGDEACDDGNGTSGDGCDVDCSVSSCGNGIAAGGEECDDGNLVDGDGCDSNCTRSSCGNAVVAGGEECDDANRKSGDGCDRDCLVESCGNGRREGNEECDSGGAPEGGEGEGDLEAEEDGCTPSCVLRARHDSVVLDRKAVALSIPVGNAPFRSNVVVQVKNADVRPVREFPGHSIRLVALDGDCPAGTVSQQPDFDRGVPGVQDTAMVAGGVPATAIAEVTVARGAFSPFDHRIPERCTLWFHAAEASGDSVDPTPDNNSLAVHLDVTDTADPVRRDDDEFYVEAMAPVTVKLAKGQGLLTRQIKPAVRRSRDLPASVADLEVTVSASDGDCPPGTVGFVDFDRRVAGQQARLMLRRGRRAKGTLGLVIRAEAFDSPGDDSPRRCTALVTATGAGDTDPSNNTTRLVIDLIDRNDF